MFSPFKEYLDQIEAEFEGSPTQKRAKAKIRISEEFGIALSSVYRIADNGKTFVFSDFKNKQIHLLRSTKTINFKK